MKHLTFLLILIIFVNTQMFSQEENPDIQTFTVKNFNLKKNDAKIKVNFDLVLSNCLDKYIFNPYYVYVKITDSANNTVYKPTGGIKIYAEKTYGKKVAEQKYLNFDIPYSSLDLPEGTHKLNLILYAENDSKKFPDFYTKKILVKIPKSYYNYEQSFVVDNYRAVGNAKKYGVKGIKINFNCTFKFTKNQIKGIETDKSLANYIFYVDLINVENNDKINLFDRPKKNVLAFTVLKKNDTYELFIPYNQINLAQGNYKVRSVLYAKTSDDKYIFKRLATDTTGIVQPKLYLLDFELINCDVQKKEYDVTSAFGRIFSSSTSNSGLGYPDVYWQLKTGSLIKYLSETNTNELWAIPGKARIVIAENEPVYFSVMDFDTLSPDDGIGIIKLKNIPENTSKKYASVHFGNVTSADFKYKKTPLFGLE